MTHELDTRNSNSIKEAAANLTRLATMNASFQKIEAATKILMKGHIEWVGAYHINDLYRGRNWSEDVLPGRVEQLLAPPSIIVKKYGRLNTPGQSLLYVGEMTQTVLNELRAKNEDRVIVMRLRKKDSLPNFRISQLGMLPTDKDEIKSSKSEQKILDYVGGNNNYQKLIVMRKCISKFFKKIVTDKCGDGFYKVTSALAQPHLNQSQIHGIVYPSVTTRYATVNLAIRPESVLEFFAPHSVVLLKVVSTDWDFHHVDTLKTGWINEVGEIIWDNSVGFESPLTESMEITQVPISTGYV